MSRESHESVPLSNQPGPAKGTAGSKKTKARKEARKVYAALDLGTNNCRLLIAEPEKSSFRVVDAFSRIVRLGEGVSRHGCLSEEAMERTISAVRICASKMRNRGVTRARCVATGACRVAGNTPEFTARVARDTGVELETISGEEEARLAVAAAAQLFDYDHRYALIFDIGGATTELIWLRLSSGRQVTVIDTTSLPCGVAVLAERHAKAKTACHPFDNMVGDAEHLLNKFEVRNEIGATVGKAKVQLLGTSGTTTTLAGIHLGLKRYERSKVDGMRLRRSDLTAVIRSVREMSADALAANGCVGKQRADWVLPGAAILQAISNRWPCRDLTVADRGIRDGILRDMIGADGGAQSAHV